jgi:integrase
MARQRNGGGVIEYPTRDGDTVYRIQYRDASGRQVKETVGRRSEGFTRTDAKAERKARIAKVAKNHYRRPDPVLFSTFAPKWFEQAQQTEGWADSTITKYNAAVERLVGYFGGYKVRDITAAQVNDYKVAALLQVGPAVVNVSLTVLGMVFRSAAEHNLIEQDRIPKVKRPHIPDYTPRALTPVEARRIEAELHKADDPQIPLAFFTIEVLGLRLFELQGLRWRNIDFLGKRIRIEKSKTKAGERSVYLPKPLSERLEAHYARTLHKGDDDYVFCHPILGTPWRADTYRRRVKAAAKKAGVQERFRPAHDLRVTSLTDGAMHGESPAVLMARAGHRSFQTTKRYLDLAGVVFEEEGEALAARRLGLEVPAES